MNELFSPMNPKSWLFAMTHPDDELAVAGMITRLVKSNHQVRICWTHTTPVRTQEAIQVAKFLGIPEENVHFFRGEDGNICDQLADLLPDFTSYLSQIRPELVVCGAYEQGHLDHDSTHWLLYRGLQKSRLSPTFYETPFYHWYRFQGLQRFNIFSDPSSATMIPLLVSEQKVKKELSKMYPSQNIRQLLTAYHAYEVLTFKKLKLYEREFVRIPNNFNYRKPNHPDRLAQKIVLHPRWQRWLGAVERAEGNL